MNLAELAKKASTKRPNHSILLYGHPKSGKTRLVGTAAQIPGIERIFWFDLENGAETLLHMDLKEEELRKITLFSIPDTKEVPRGIETVLKALTSKVAVKICDNHGKVECVECKKIEATEGTFLLSACTNKDLVVIDSGSQLGDSALHMAMLGKSGKPGYDEYEQVRQQLNSIMSIMQASQYTNFVLITHVIPIEEEMNGIVKDRFFPLVGTKPFCQKVAKYFGTVIFVEIKLGKHAAGSSSLYKNDATTGSRTGAKIEASKELSMKSILVEGGIL